MALPQQKFREVVFQLLYSTDFADVEKGEATHPFLMHQLKVTKKAMREAQAKVDLIIEKKEEIDSQITQVSQSYSFARITSVEKNILRLAVYEMLFDDTIPPKVAISEAVRLCRKFSTPEGGTFVNGVLDAIYQPV